MSTPPPLPPESGPVTADSPTRLPWEERARLGLLESLVQTVRLLVTQPADAFSRLRPDGDLSSPMLFGIVVSWVSVLFSQLWNLLLTNSFRGAFEGIEGFEGIFQAPSVGQIVGMTLLWPVIFVVMAFIGSGILHLCLMLVGAMEHSQQGFEGTLKVYVYGTVSWLALLVPIVGGLVGSIWLLVLQVMGFAEVHRTSQGRALAAVLIPSIVCCLCTLVTATLFGAVIYRMMEEILRQGGFQ